MVLRDYQLVDVGLNVAVKFVFKDKVPANAWVRDAELGIVPIEAFVIKNVNHKNIIDYVGFFEVRSGRGFIRLLSTVLG